MTRAGSAHGTESLPAIWRAAFERERAGVRTGADPAPERQAARLLAAFVAVGLFFLVLPGTLIGVGNLLLIAMERLPTAPRPAWIQAHGQAQILGWVGSFMLGIALFILPKRQVADRRHIRLGWLAWALWSAAALIRWRAGTSATDPRPWLIAAALLFLAGFLLVQWILWRPQHRSSNSDRALPALVATGFTGLGLALLVNLAGAWASNPVTAALPATWDRTLIEIEVWAFILPVAAGFSTRFVATALGLRPHRFRARPLLWLQAGFTVLALAALTRVFIAADGLAVVLVAAIVWGLRIFEPPASAPKMVGVYAGFTAFLRLAYIWLCAGATLGVAAALLPSHPGLTGASRHAVTVGFVVTLIFCVGPRILPSFLNRRQLFSRSLMALSLWFITAGCLLRVISEAAAYGTLHSWAWMWLPISAYIELLAILLFVINLAATMLRRAPIWFRLETITAATPVYWYTASYPATRAVLVQAGLSTLARTKDVPRTLTLEEAAAADQVESEQLVEALRSFFRTKQS